MTTNAKTEHSKKLRAASARKARDKAFAEGKIKQININAPPVVIDDFLGHMRATGKKTRAQQLQEINSILSDK